MRYSLFAVWGICWSLVSSNRTAENYPQFRGANQNADLAR